MKVGLIVRSDESGLGNQTRNLCYMLKPDKVLVINSRGFTNGRKQNNHWYIDFKAWTTASWPTLNDVRAFLKDIDVLISCEMFYNPLFITEARRRGIKTVLQCNYEFLDNLNNENHPLPDLFLAPSTWHIKEIEKLGVPTIYLPPPIDFSQFTQARNNNWSGRHKKILHVAGRRAVHDRNGTELIIEALKYTEAPIEIVIKVQEWGVSFDKDVNYDPRITFDFSNPKDESELYSGYDAVILPRRYGGLCLPMNEGLLSGLPVIMPDCSPNGDVLPKDWLMAGKYDGHFMTRTRIDLFNTYPKEIAEQIEKIFYIDDEQLSKMKVDAYDVGDKNFTYSALKERYEEALNSL